MEKKRSVGVTLFGIVFIVGGIALCGLGALFWFYISTSPYYRGFQIRPIEYFLHSALFSFFPLMTFFTGIGALLLKLWSRRMIVLAIPPFFFLSLLWIDYLSVGRGWAGKYSFLEYANIFFDSSHLHVVALICIFSIVILCPIIFFFTRPKVKEQFSQ